MRIEIQGISLRLQKITKQYDYFVELKDDYFHYKHKFRADEPKDKEDLDLGWEKVNNYFERVVEKRLISAIDLEFIHATVQNKNEENKWSVTIQVHGVNNDCIIYFKDEYEGRIFFDKLIQWRFGILPLIHK